MVAVSADQFVEKYIALPGAGDQDLDRVVTAPSGLDAVGMLEALAHPSFTEPGRQAIALQMMSDFMAPTGSIYYDAAGTSLAAPGFYKNQADLLNAHQWSGTAWVLTQAC